MKFSKHLFANEIKDILLAYVKLLKGICILTLRTERKASRYKHSFDQCKGQFAKAAITYETRLWIGMYFDDQFGTTSVENTRRRTFSNGIHRKMMLFVCMRERLAQERQAYEGFNPVGILSRIVAKTEIGFI